MADYILVEIDELINYINIASSEEEYDIAFSLGKLFRDANSFEIKIYKNTKEANYLINKNPNFNNDNLITLESLSLAFSRLYLDKNNKELFNKIKKYLHDFRENIKNGVSNTPLRNIIMNDIDSYLYIIKFKNFEEYEKFISLKNLKTKEKQIIKKEENYIKGKSII